MATDPYAPSTREDAPRQEPNLAPGVRLPPASRAAVDRPGEHEPGRPTGKLFGNPGPNVGYALTLCARLRDRLTLARHEQREDATAVIAELAMRRAASFGRAPVMADIERAAEVFGYLGAAPDDFVDWRTSALAHTSHDYGKRRAAVNAVPDSALGTAALSPGDLQVLRDALRVAPATH